jgi:protein-tyrosine phosphatase
VTDENKELPEIRFGAEVYFFDGISDCEFISQLAVEDSKSIMVEMPMRRWSDRIICELDGIRQKQSLTPIIAHIDRYVELLDKNVFPKLSEMGVLIQANAEFFISRKTRKTALKMLSRGDIHLLGSDCHDLSERKPNLKEALDIIIANLGEEAVGFINRCELSV